MIRRAAAAMRAIVPHIDAEDLLGLVCLAGLWYGLHLVSDALAWTVVSALGLALALLVAMRRPSSPAPSLPAEPPADMSDEQFAALMGRRSVSG